MYRRITKTAVILALAVALVLCTALPASAEVTSYEFVCNEPQISNNSCYFEIVQADGTAFIYYVTLSLHNLEELDRYSIGFRANLDDNKNLWVYYYNRDDSGTLDLSSVVGVKIMQNGSISSETNGNGSCGVFVGWNFKCIRAYNCEFESSVGSDCVFVYGNDININNKLDDIIAILSNQDNSDIIVNQDENTDKIIENQQQIQENEKIETESSGNSGIDGVTSVLPELDTDGIKSGIEKLTNSISNDSRYCSWVFPSLKIPAIPNVCDEIVLTQEKEIIFSDMIAKIPDRALSIVRALCSVGLILFILYEFVSFIIYCFTLNKNDVGKDDDE